MSFWSKASALTLAILLSACISPEDALSPFLPDIPDFDAGTAGTAGTAGGNADAGDGGVPSIPCEQDSDCEDEYDCTENYCDSSTNTCAYTLNHSICQDTIFCNGEEICDISLGCKSGPPVTCSDDDTCTIDSCDETSGLCVHKPRDADNDGEIDIHCGGTDCDDTNGLVSSTSPEICSNNRDDNCDGTIDEPECEASAHDRCDQALELPGPGAFALSTLGAQLQTSSTCQLPNPTTARDVMAVFDVPEGPNQRVDLKATASSSNIVLSLFSDCGEGATEILCANSSPGPSSGQLAAIRAWDLPPGTYYAIMYTETGSEITLELAFSSAGEAPSNETCGTAQTISANEVVQVPLVGVAADLGTACVGATGDLVYKLTLDEKQDIRAFASSSAPNINVSLSLRDETCSDATSEITCRYYNPVTLFRRSLGPGDIYFSVRASSATDATLLVTLEPPTDPPADDLCETAPEAIINGSEIFSFTDYGDDVSLCVAGLVDVIKKIDVVTASDVLAVLKDSTSGSRAISIVGGDCTNPDDLISCTATGQSPIRTLAHNVAPGSYRIVAERNGDSGAELTVATRPTEAAVFVPFADTCDDAFVIPATGGRFLGNTANANAQYSTSCDQAGTGPFGAPEQMLKLELPDARRVILESRNSSYAVMLSVLQNTCPGPTVPFGCTVGDNQRSFLDLDLPAGVYFIQVDGFALDAGLWDLEVWVLPPSPMQTQ